MWRWPRVLAGLLGAGLLIGACSGPDQGGGPSGSPAGSSSASASASPTGRALAPTGITLAGGGRGAQGMVADGTGEVWVDGPWQVARLDPVTGAARVWTIADDAAFARGGLVAGAQTTPGATGSGVWFAAGDAVVLFDGTRFTRELVIPAPYGGSDAVGSLAVAGDQVWITAVGGSLVRGTVLEWRDGAWAEVGPAVGPLVVDAGGALWSGPTRLEPDGSWATPDEGVAPEEGSLNVLVADPFRGVWGVQPDWLYQFDGAGWSRWELPEVPVTNSERGEWSPSSMAISEVGEAWLAGEDAVVRRDAGGAWSTFTTGQGLTDGWPQGFDRRVLVVADQVLVTDPTGVLRLDGGRFVPLWADPATAPVWSAGCLNAVSGAEAWVSARVTPRPGPPASWQDPSPLARFADGSWATGGPGVLSCLGLAVGPDGAMWAITPVGLVRFAGGEWVTVDESITSGPLAVGPDGVAWAMDSDRLVRIDPDGERTVIGRTPLGRAPRAVLLSSGQPGVVWVGTSAWEAAPRAARWDGEWTRIPVDAWTLQILATADGSLWAGASDNETGWLIRYADGRWSEVPGSRGRIGGAALEQSPAGGACASGTDGGGGIVMTCFGADGPTATVALPDLTGEVSIGRDGAVWVLGDQVGRLPDEVLPWAVVPAS